MDPASAGSSPAAQQYTPAAQPYTSVKMTDTHQTELLRVSEHPTDALDQRKDNYVTPPTSTYDAVSSSSSKRAERRAATRSASPLGFGAGVRNVPSPIRTDLQKSILPAIQRQKREHLPDAPHNLISNGSNTALHGAEAYPATFSNYQSNIIAPTGPQSCQSDVSRSHEYSNGMRQSDIQNDQDSFEKNPYDHRANEIGQRHNVPGITHLGGLLAPPEWKEGDEPINPLRASKIFESSREEAKEILKLNTEQARHLPPQERDKYEADINKQWVIDHTLDKTLFNERLTVYEQYHERKQAKMQQQYEQVSSLPRPIAAPAKPLNPPTTTSYAMSSNPAFQYASTLNGHPTQRNGMYLMRSQPAEESFFNPAFGTNVIDPSIMQQTRESAYGHYQTGRDRNQQLTYANDRSYTSRVNNFETRPPVQRARPFYGSREDNRGAAQDHQYLASVPRPPQYVSPTRTQFAEPSNASGFGGFTEAQFSPMPLGFPQRGPAGYLLPGPQMNQTYAPDTSNVMQETAYGNPSNGRHINQGFGTHWTTAAGNSPENHNIRMTPTNEPKVSKENSEKHKRKRGPKEKPEKRKTWYHDEIQNMNLPTSVISAEALQAGYDYDVNAGSRAKAKRDEKTAPKKRQRNKAIIDPEVGIIISADEGRLLIAQGAEDNTMQAYSTTTDRIGNGVAPGPGGISAYASSYNPGPSDQSNSIIAQDAQPEEYPELDISSDDIDDPNDDDFGRRTSRRKTVSPRKRAPRSAARPNNKRKSGA